MKLDPRKWRIAAQVGIGLGICLVIVVFIGVFAVTNLKSSGEAFDQYRKIARETNELGRIQANLLLARLSVKNFIISPTEESIANVVRRTDATEELIENTIALTTTREVADIVRNADIEIEQYRSVFEKVIELQNQRNELVLNNLNRIGPQIERQLTQIMQSALEGNNTDAAVGAGKALRSLLLARLYVQRFLIQNDSASLERSRAEFDAFSQEANDMQGLLRTPDRKQLAAQVMSGAQT